MLAQVAGITLDDVTMASVMAALGSNHQPVAIDRARIDRQIRELALEAEQVATVEQVELGERVAEGVGVCPDAIELRPPAKPAEGMLDCSRGERPAVAGEEDVIDVASDRPRPAVGEVVRQAASITVPRGTSRYLPPLPRTRR